MLPTLMDGRDLTKRNFEDHLKSRDHTTSGAIQAHRTETKAVGTIASEPILIVPRATLAPLASVGSSTRTAIVELRPSH